MSGAEVAILAISTVATAATAYAGAQQQNRAIRRASQSQQRAADIQSAQVRQAAELEKQKRMKEAARIRGLIRAREADAGVTGGSYDALVRQTAADEALNLSILDQNKRNQIAAVQSGATAEIERLSAGVSNELLAAFGGGLSGAQTGLQIGSLQREARRYKETP